jgi:hypothetical protein
MDSLRIRDVDGKDGLERSELFGEGEAGDIPLK